MDDDDFRRGKPSMHKQYAEVARKQKFSEPDRFGVNMAICGADMCLFIAISILSKQTASITGLYSDMLIKVCGGQMQDILLQARPRNPSRSDIYKLMRAKTASYTLSLPLMAGASLSGQPQVVINKLCRFGEAAGVIFQIRDDELGVIGDTEKTGKPVGADIREGKQTLISYYLLKACGASERRQLRAVLGNQNITAGDIAWVQGLIKKHGVSQMINEEIRYLERKASIALETIDISSQNQKELKSLLAFCAKRKT
jgi:geranylgeranyl diphosphate synthase type I